MSDLTGSQLLFMGAKRGCVGDITTAVTSQGVDVNTRDELGNTPMHYAAGSGHPDAVAELLRLGADVALTNNVGDTPLHKAAFRGNVPAVKALVAAGAAVDAQNSLGQTPKDLATNFPAVLDELVPPTEEDFSNLVDSDDENGDEEGY